MIRPFTLLCFLLACGSGLYLYQSKHRAQMLDRQIEQTVRDTQAARDKTRLLEAEWTLLNDPERLRALSDQFLALKTVVPGQFTTMAELDHRLPPVLPPDAPREHPPEPAGMPQMTAPPVAQSAPEQAPAAAGAEAPAKPAVAQAKPTPSAAAASAVAAAVPPERTPGTERKPVTPRPAAEPARPAVVASALPRPQPVSTPRYSAPITPVAVAAQAPAPSVGVGSALGMAGRTSLPPPKPIALFQPLDGH